MDYGQHLVTTLVCFVKAEGGRGLLSEGGGGFGPRGLLSGGLMSRGAYVLHPYIA